MITLTRRPLLCLFRNRMMTAVEDVSHIIVCVTGVSGFLGEHIVKCLLEKGYTVRGTVRDPTKEGPLQVSREQGG